MRLQDKVAIVTGGSRGIGKAISLRMADEGAKVVVNYNSHSESANDVIKRIKEKNGTVIAIKADVSQKDEVENMVRTTIREFGRIDILVNNAGVCPFVKFFEITEDIWKRIQDINTKGIFLTSQAVAREMIKTCGGRIINVTSISGERVTSEMQVPYCVSKAGANMLTRAMAVALAPYKINVNAILPGTIETDINRNVLSNIEVRQGIIDSTPLKTLGKAEDIAGAVIFLASDEAKWITGSLIVIDGGFLS